MCDASQASHSMRKFLETDWEKRTDVLFHSQATAVPSKKDPGAKSVFTAKKCMSLGICICSRNRAGQHAEHFNAKLKSFFRSIFKKGTPAKRKLDANLVVLRFQQHPIQDHRPLYYHLGYCNCQTWLFTLLKMAADSRKPIKEHNTPLRLADSREGVHTPLEGIDLSVRVFAGFDLQAMWICDICCLSQSDQTLSNRSDLVPERVEIEADRRVSHGAGSDRPSDMPTFLWHGWESEKPKPKKRRRKAPPKEKPGKDKKQTDSSKKGKACSSQAKGKKPKPADAPSVPVEGLEGSCASASTPSHLHQVPNSDVDMVDDMDNDDGCMDSMDGFLQRANEAAQALAVAAAAAGGDAAACFAADQDYQPESDANTASSLANDQEDRSECQEGNSESSESSGDEVADPWVRASAEWLDRAELDFLCHARHELPDENDLTSHLADIVQEVASEALHAREPIVSPKRLDFDDTVDTDNCCPDQDVHPPSVSISSDHLPEPQLGTNDSPAEQKEVDADSSISSASEISSLNSRDLELLSDIDFVAISGSLSQDDERQATSRTRPGDKAKSSKEPKPPKDKLATRTDSNSDMAKVKPERAEKEADVRFEFCENGSIRYNVKSGNLVAHCCFHSGNCRRTRTTKEPSARGNRSQGRPMGLLAAWLQAAAQYPNASSHSSDCRPSLLERQECRRKVMAMDKGPGFCGEFERAKREDEDDEPEAMM